jgi:hypothetical protein
VSLAATVKQLGGTPVTPKQKYDFPVDQLESQADVLRFAAGLEQGAVSAYLEAVPAFDNRDLARAAARTTYRFATLTASSKAPSPANGHSSKCRR